MTYHLTLYTIAQGQQNIMQSQMAFFFCIFVSLPCDTKFVVIASRSEFSADQNDRSYDLAVIRPFLGGFKLGHYLWGG